MPVLLLEQLVVTRAKKPVLLLVVRLVVTRVTKACMSTVPNNIVYLTFYISILGTLTIGNMEFKKKPSNYSLKKSLNKSFLSQKELRKTSLFLKSYKKMLNLVSKN